jgi:hypothetical protein
MFWEGLGTDTTQSNLNRNYRLIYTMKATHSIIVVAILIATLISLMSEPALSETFAQHKDTPQQIPVGAAEEDERQNMTQSPKFNLTATDTKLLKIYIDEARKALKNTDINKALANLNLAEHLLQLVQSYQQQHSSIQNGS